MLIPVPKTAAPIVRIIALLPEGIDNITHELIPDAGHCEIVLPEGVDESAVAVIAEDLNNAREVVSSQVLKTAELKPVEDAPAEEPDEPAEEPADEEDTDLAQEAE